MGRGKSREKILHELLTRCPGSFCLDHSTNVMGTSSCQRVCYPITYQRCIKDSRGISPSAHEGELCHCLLLILAPCVIIINPSEPVSQSYCCRSPKPVTFTLHLSISRSLHPTNPWNTLIVSVRCVLFVTIEPPLQNNKNQQTFFLLLSKKSCRTMTKRIPLTSGGQKRKWQLKQQFWRSIFKKIKGSGLHINILLQHPELLNPLQSS